MEPIFFAAAIVRADEYTLLARRVDEGVLDGNKQHTLLHDAGVWTALHANPQSLRATLEHRTVRAAA